MDSLGSTLTPLRLLTETVQFSQGFQRDLSALQERVADLKRKIHEIAGESVNPPKVSYTAEPITLDAITHSIAELRNKIIPLQHPSIAPANSEIDEALGALALRLPTHNNVHANGNGAFYTDFTIDQTWKKHPECRSLKTHDVDLYNLQMILSSSHVASIQVSIPAEVLAKIFSISEKASPVQEGYMFCYRTHRHAGLDYQIHDATLNHLVKAKLGALLMDKIIERRLLDIIDQTISPSTSILAIISWGPHRALIPNLNLRELTQQIDAWKKNESIAAINPSLVRFFANDLESMDAEENLLKHLRTKTHLMIIRSAFHLILGSSEMKAKQEVIHSLQQKYQSLEAQELISACAKALKPFDIKISEHQVNTQTLFSESSLELFLFKVAIQFQDQPTKLNCLRCYIRQAAAEYSFQLLHRIPLGTTPIYSEINVFTLDNFFASKGQQL